MPQHCAGAVQSLGPSHVAVTPTQAAVAATQCGAVMKSTQHLVSGPQIPPEPHATPGPPWSALHVPSKQPSPAGQPCVASHLNITPAVGSPYEHATISTSASDFTKRTLARC